MENTKIALIIVDVQNDYFKGGKFELVGMEEASKNSQALLEHFRANKKPVIHIQHFNVFEGAPFFIPNHEGSEIHENVKPKGDEIIITKNFPSAFQKTELHDVLQKMGITDLVIVGAMSHMCIDTTTRQAYDLGYSCKVIHDACATRDLEFDGKVVKAADVQVSYMAALQFWFAKVLSAQEYLRASA